MAEQALKGVTMLVLIVTLAFITAVVSANAQVKSSRHADKPFEFTVSEQQFAAVAGTVAPLMEK